MGVAWTEGSRPEYDRRMSETIERQFNKIIRDQALYEGEQERKGNPICWAAVFVWFILVPLLFVVTYFFLFKVATATWGDVASWVSRS